ncbi:MAG: tRNA epoxyqueuosine(34) reductase QueG [Cyclobacteriaceae bacterium]|nr:tRNA epoxyqueuosine(34) reductase QueG [Cyclobacteriaceae bacterium]
MLIDTRREHTSIVKQEAKESGFDFCGISKAEYFHEEAPRLEKWLANGYHGKMDYMANHFDKRLDPSRLVEGARSVISLLYNYYPEKKLPQENNFKISKYAYGKDYHFVLKKKLKEFLSRLSNRIGEIHGRVFVDSAPVLERQLAAKSGLGWIGKNTMLINKQHGSYFFIAELITDLELIEDGPIPDYCGTCTRCMDACPTNALSPYHMDATKCISYLTIELKDHIPEEFEGKMKDWIFGCDICQDVCPWNRFARPHSQPDFLPREELFDFDKNSWKELTEDTFFGLFGKSAIKRTGYDGLKRNIHAAESNLQPSPSPHKNEHDNHTDQHQE